MTIWLWIFLASNAVYWLIFFRLLSRRRWDAAALAVGAIHMLFAATTSVAPIRALIDTGYMGWQFGLIRFEGRAAALPALLVLAWALAAAWFAVAKGRGRWMALVAAGDLFWTVNFGVDFLLDLFRGRLAEAKLQGGEHFTLTGPVAAFIPVLLFMLPFVVSAVWAVRRIRAGRERLA